MEASFSSNKPYMLRAVYDWIIDNDATPYLLVDANQASVCVPTQHIQNGQIVLNVEPSAIQNWFSDNDAISFSARFSGKAMNIFIPMTALLAIYAQENGLGMAFPPEEAIEGTIPKVENNDSKFQIIENRDDVTLDTASSGIGSDTDINNSNSDSQEEQSAEQKLAEVVSIKTKKSSHLKVIK
ncbi:MAG: ClpXP protease specificity-enhancing factor [Gammaproteobacteria bacterium]|nr:MAG: ClpXP protease specificity-enhancing factor [Gammaproteobacteria bacterium]